MNKWVLIFVILMISGGGCNPVAATELGELSQCVNDENFVICAKCSQTQPGSFSHQLMLLVSKVTLSSYPV